MDSNQHSQKYHEMLQEKVYTNIEGIPQEEKTMPTTRLKQKIEQQSKKKFLLFSIATLLVLFVLIQYGIPFIINTTVFLTGKHTDTTDKTQQQSAFLAAPILDNTFEATNSAKVNISGTSAKDQKIRLYVNDRLIDTVNTSSDGTFSFQDVALKSGINSFKAKAVVDNQESDFSQEIEIIYQEKAPELTIDRPSDGQSFSKEQKSLIVSGIVTDPDASVTVNNFRAIVESNGKFSYTITLQNGENNIKIVAVDAAGNKAEKEIKVTYSE